MKTNTNATKLQVDNSFKGALISQIIKDKDKELLELSLNSGMLNAKDCIDILKEI